MSFDPTFNGIDAYVPDIEDIPKDFFASNNTWNRTASLWFFKGIEVKKRVSNPGIDVNKAIHHLHFIISSRVLEHNYKIAAAAYLMSSWFQIFEYETD